MSLPTLSRSDNQYDVFMHPMQNDLPSVPVYQCLPSDAATPRTSFGWVFLYPCNGPGKDARVQVGRLAVEQVRTIFLRVIPESAVSCARDPGEFRYWAKTLDAPGTRIRNTLLGEVENPPFACTEFEIASSRKLSAPCLPPGGLHAARKITKRATPTAE